MKGLSAAQQHVIDRMNNGWELGADVRSKGHDFPTERFELVPA